MVNTVYRRASDGVFIAENQAEGILATIIPRIGERVRIYPNSYEVVGVIHLLKSGKSDTAEVEILLK